MKFFIFIFALSVTQVSFAADLVVNCKAPVGFAGQSATIKGKLKKSNKLQQGYYFVKGNLKIVVGGSSIRSLYSNTVSVRGPILDDGALHLGAEKNPEFSIIYINKLKKDVSYVELDGKMYITNCTE